MENIKKKKKKNLLKSKEEFKPCRQQHLSYDLNTEMNSEKLSQGLS